MNHLLFFVNSIALGVGLAMDAFSVSLANGLRETRMKPRRMVGIAGVYAGFQFLMPMIGWFLVRTAAGAFSVIRPFIPWIALLLLTWIGGKMLREGVVQWHATKKQAAGISAVGSDTPSVLSLPDGNTATQGILSARELLAQGIATSIDALSVGFTIVEYQALSAFFASLIIAIVTLVICLFGLRLGKAFGTRLAHRASVVGGLILIGIGLEIFLRGVL